MGKHKHRVHVSLLDVDQPEISLGAHRGKGSAGSAGDARYVQAQRKEMK